MNALFLALTDQYPSSACTHALVNLTGAEDAGVRALALEALMSAPGALDDVRLAALATDPAPTVAALAVIAIARRRTPDRAEQETLSRVLAGPERFHVRALHMIRRARDPALRPLLMRLREATSAAALPELLDAAAALGAEAPVRRHVQPAISRQYGQRLHQSLRGSCGADGLEGFLNRSPPITRQRGTSGRSAAAPTP